VALDAQGHSSFERLQERMHVRAPTRALSRKYASFTSLSDLLLLRRLRPSRSASARAQTAPARLLYPSDGFATPTISWNTGKSCSRLQNKNGLEGIVAKRADSPYVSDRKPILGEAEEYQDSRRVVGAGLNLELCFFPLAHCCWACIKVKTSFIGHVGSGFDGKS